MKKISLVGRVFGRLTVLQEAPERSPQGRILWECVCSCGSRVSVRGGDLQQGKTVSCGCYLRERTKSMGLKSVHGMTGTPTWKSWESMISRCHRESDPSYHNYGAKGITVCDSWLRSFVHFFEDMGERPEGHTLDRIESTKGYSPENCRWATPKTQSNNKGNNVRVRYAGRTLTVAQWSIRRGIPASTIYTRLRKGWSVEDALTINYRRRRP